MEAVEALALVAGHVEEEVLLRNQYVAAENEIARSMLPGRVRLTDSEWIGAGDGATPVGLAEPYRLDLPSSYRPSFVVDSEPDRVRAM